MDSPYEVLGIDPGSDESAVVEAYRRRVKETHPDRGGSADEFQRVQTAYAQIRNGVGPSGPGRTTVDGPATNGSKTSREESTGTRLEFLNYEVVGPQGWDIGDDDLFEKAADADLGPEDYGRIFVEPDETILEAAENRGYSWPFSCRGGACANCAIAVVDGGVEMPSNHVLSTELLDGGIRLSCIASPVTDEMQVLYNIGDLPGLRELRLPPQQFER